MIKRRVAAVGMILVMLAGVGLPVRAEGLETGRFELPGFDVPCRAAILIDQDSGTVLYEKQADEQMPVASITKVMTLLLTMEALDGGKVALTDVVPVSDHSYNMGGSQIWLEPGEQFTLDEMLKAICVSSANDAAVAVSEFIGGSEPAFVERMNQRAAELGMKNTSFKNACGLDEEGHLSTARDVAIMSREILTAHPRITEYTTIWTESLRAGQTQLVNTNKLIRTYEGITGLKTGTTSGAGVCLSASASRNGLSLIAVVLGSPSSAERFAAATALLDYGFANFETVPAPVPPQAPQTLPVVGGAEEQVQLQYALPQNLLVKKGEGENLSASLELAENVPAPVEQGAQLGTVSIYAADMLLGQWPVCAAQGVAEMNLKLAFHRLIQALIHY